MWFKNACGVFWREFHFIEVRRCNFLDKYIYIPAFSKGCSRVTWNHALPGCALEKLLQSSFSSQLNLIDSLTNQQKPSLLKFCTGGLKMTRNDTRMTRGPFWIRGAWLQPLSFRGALLPPFNICLNTTRHANDIKWHAPRGPSALSYSILYKPIHSGMNRSWEIKGPLGYTPLMGCLTETRLKVLVYKYKHILYIFFPRVCKECYYRGSNRPGLLSTGLQEFSCQWEPFCSATCCRTDQWWLVSPGNW